MHLIVVTQYHRDVLTSEHPNFPHPVLSTRCADFGADLSEFDGEDDHVHLLTQYPPQAQVPRLANSLKGVSSRRLRQQFQARTHRNHLWSPSYFAVSCGGAPQSTTREYVENQRHSS